MSAETNQNLLDILVLIHEKHQKLVVLIQLVRLKEEASEGEWLTHLKEVQALCEEIIQKTQLEQDLTKQWERSESGELAALKKFDVQALRMVEVVRGKAVGNERFAQLPNLLQNLGQLEKEEERIVKEVLSVFWLLAKLRSVNVAQKKIFETKTYADFLEKGHGALAKSVMEEIEIVSSTLVLFKSLLEGTSLETKTKLAIYEKVKTGAFDDVNQLAESHFVQAIQARDSITMQHNEAEAALLAQAEQRGVKMFDEKEDLGRTLLEGLGREYALVSSGDTHNVSWDTIPIVRKTLAQLIHFIGVQWKSQFSNVFSGQAAKLIIASLSRTRQDQESLFQVNPYATTPEKSAHVRGLAVDFATGELSKLILKQMGITDPGEIQKRMSAIQDKVVELLRAILKPLMDKEANGASIINAFLEGHGCFHVSINPDPDAVFILEMALG
ncbi:MAG: DUF5715 family protein [Nanoarchaeota archaeon]